VASRLSGTGPFASASLVPANVAETTVISRVNPVVPQDTGVRKPVTVTLKISVDENGNVTWARPLSREEPYTSASVKAVEQRRLSRCKYWVGSADMITAVTLNFP
jgi:hypothetical protein